jgi:hypothetical protein
MSVSIFRVNEIKSNYYYPRANGAKPRGECTANSAQKFC